MATVKKGSKINFYKFVDADKESDARSKGGATKSTIALTNSTLSYIIELANKGWKKACQENSSLAKGLNIINGKVVYKQVAEAFDLDFTEVESLI